LNIKHLIFLVALQLVKALWLFLRGGGEERELEKTHLRGLPKEGEEGGGGREGGPAAAVPDPAQESLRLLWDRRGMPELSVGVDVNK